MHGMQEWAVTQTARVHMERDSETEKVLSDVKKLFQDCTDGLSQIRDLRLDGEAPTKVRRRRSSVRPVQMVPAVEALVDDDQVWMEAEVDHPTPNPNEWKASKASSVWVQGPRGRLPMGSCCFGICLPK